MSNNQIRSNDNLQQPGCDKWLNTNSMEEFSHSLSVTEILATYSRLTNAISFWQKSWHTACNIVQERKDLWLFLIIIAGAFLDEACRGVAIKLILHPVTDNYLYLSTRNTNDFRLDISVRRFWITVQKSFFDAKVFEPNATQYQSRSL